MPERKQRVMDTNAYLDTLRELVENGQQVSLKISGNSMMPFLIHGRDTILFGPVEKELKKGDMVFYQRTDGQYVMHRICRVAPEGYYIIGDAQCDIEGPVDRSRIFAIVSAACRKGKWIQKGSFWWEFFAHVWIRMIPVRHPIMRIYGRIMGKKKS